MSVVKWVFEDYWQGQVQHAWFYYTGSTQTFTVPDDVYHIHVSARGAHGGGMTSKGVALGGYINGWFDVNPGDQFDIGVGGVGHAPNGSSGGSGGYGFGGDGGDSILLSGGYGGGGETAIRPHGYTSLASRLVVAAGGGGSSGDGRPGGVGGPNGEDAVDPRHGAAGGKGGTQTHGGAHGSNGGTDGALGFGGDGANNGFHPAAGGGGAGYYGGGGGGWAGTEGVLGSVGGGGGSNLVNGYSPDFPIQSRPGEIVVGGSNLRQGYVAIAWHGIADTYTFHINPNDGGSLSIQKNVAISQNLGPNRVNIIQEGQNQAPSLPFSGVILDQDQLEAMEKWYDRRTFLKVTDDLGREYFGVFSQFAPKRVRRASNFWYHTYEAQLTVSAYKNASGEWVYGRVL